MQVQAQLRFEAGEGPPHARLAAGSSPIRPRPKAVRPLRSAHMVRSSPIRPRNWGSNWHIVDSHPESGTCSVSSHPKRSHSPPRAGTVVLRCRPGQALRVRSGLRAHACPQRGEQVPGSLSQISKKIHISKKFLLTWAMSRNKVLNCYCLAPNWHLPKEETSRGQR